jgi:hypothetical protein
MFKGSEPTCNGRRRFPLLETLIDEALCAREVPVMHKQVFNLRDFFAAPEKLKESVGVELLRP